MASWRGSMRKSPIANTAVWVDPAVQKIRTECSAPELASRLKAADLDLTRNCKSTAKLFANTFCAYNDDRNTFLYHKDEYRWNSTKNPPPIDQSSLLASIRDSLPPTFGDISDVVLLTWDDIVIDTLNDGQISKICKECIDEFCAAAAFTGEPDVAGQGAIVSYIVGVTLVATGALGWLLSFTISFKRTCMRPLWTAAYSTGEVLLSCSAALAASLTIACLFSLKRTFYQQVMTQNATFLSLNIFRLLSYFLYQLASPEGQKPTAKWPVSYGILVIVQLSIAYTYLQSKQDLFQDSGDGPCFRSLMGRSALSNPRFYAAAFLVPTALAGLLNVLDLVLLIPRLVSRSRRGYFPLQSVAYQIAFSPFEPPSRSEHRVGTWPIWGIIEDYFARICDTATPAILFCFALLMCLEMSYLLRLRAAMQILAGDWWTEGELGFGQILALLLWLPVLLVFFNTLITEEWKLARKHFEPYWMRWIDKHR
ncbi:hypothetical protein ONS96_009352 [Cadophora gregata f. sp. sojae]|nr:hypothetical protein ONS96_009352 [Cadophora gregata f. sp. sojae]